MAALRHVVMFRFKAETSSAKVAEIEAAFVEALHRGFAGDREPAELDLGEVLSESVPPRHLHERGHRTTAALGQGPGQRSLRCDPPRDPCTALAALARLAGRLGRRRGVQVSWKRGGDSLLIGRSC